MFLTQTATPASSPKVVEPALEPEAHAVSVPIPQVENEAPLSPATASPHLDSPSDLEIDKALERIVELRQFRPPPEEEPTDLPTERSTPDTDFSASTNIDPVEVPESAPFVQWPDSTTGPDSIGMDAFQKFVSEMFRAETGAEIEPERSLPTAISSTPADDVDAPPSPVLESTISSPPELTPEDIWRLAIAEEPLGENASQTEATTIAPQPESSSEPNQPHESNEASDTLSTRPHDAAQSVDSTLDAFTSLFGEEPEKLAENLFSSPSSLASPEVTASEWPENLRPIHKGITLSPEEETELEAPVSAALVSTLLETVPEPRVEPPDSSGSPFQLPPVPSLYSAKSIPIPAASKPPPSSVKPWKPFVFLLLLGAIAGVVLKFFPFRSPIPTQNPSTSSSAQPPQIDPITLPTPPPPPPPVLPPPPPPVASPPPVEVAATPIPPPLPEPTAPASAPPPPPISKFEIRPAGTLPELPSEPEPKPPSAPGKPEDPAQEAARHAVEKFLSSTSKAELLERIIAPKTFASRVEAFYADKPISPINFDNIVLESSAIVPETKFKAFLFRVRSPDRPLGFPVCAEETSQGYKVEWEVFTQCQKRTAANFWKSANEPPATLYVIVKRAHYFDNDIPNLESYECFEVVTPNPDDEKMYAFAKKDGAFERKFRQRLNWHNRYFVVGQFGHSSHGNGGSHVEILDVIRFNWRSQSP